MIIRDLYALSSNDTTKFADWVCYRLTPHLVWADGDRDRKWRAAPMLDDAETLEPKDYKGIAQMDMDRGHQAPLASFQGALNWHTANYMSNITPQKSDLNQGPWRILEEWIRKLTRYQGEVWVYTGPLYEREMPPLPHADEPHKVPSGYWKIVAIPQGKSLKLAAFIFDQETPREASVLDHVVTVREVEDRSGLSFFRLLPQETQDRIETKKEQNWVVTWKDLVR
jgi:endonuclease G